LNLSYNHHKLLSNLLLTR